METSSKDPTPTVSRRGEDEIVELVYSPRNRTTAFAVAKDGAWNILEHHVTEHGETLVPYGPSNNLIAHGCVLLPETPIASGGKARLLADIGAYLHRYVDFSPLFEKIAAHYVLLSWVYDAFREIPMLRVRGAFGAGKTRALLALGSISYKGFFSSGASTVSPIFHTLDRFGGTLVLDEADLRYSDKTADLVKILNNGTVRGLPVLRTIKNRHKEFNPAAFTVFGPKIVAMRGSFRDPALESRFITEQMGTRALREDIPVLLPDTFQEEAATLRNRLLGFRFEDLFRIASDSTRAVAGVDPRLNQMALPLLSLMDDIALREDVAAMLVQHQASIAVEREWTSEARVVAALKAACQIAKGNIPLQEIARQANQGGNDASLTARDVGRVLRDLSIPLRKSHGLIVVPRAALPEKAA